MNFFDLSIINFLNKFSQHSWAFDNIMNFIANNNLVKGGIFTIVIWWFWFNKSSNQSEVREHIISIIISCFIIVVLARVLSLLLPYRERPFHNLALNFIPPYGTNTLSLTNWSSFPSDHAALFFTLATGFFFISKKIGIFAYIYTTFIISLPRIYLGLHNPTDIICGCLLGLAIGWVTNRSIMSKKISKSILTWNEKAPGVFYAMFFLITYQIAELFDSSRNFLSFSVKILKHIM